MQKYDVLDMSSTDQSGDSSSDRDVEFYYRPGKCDSIKIYQKVLLSLSDAGFRRIFISTPVPKLVHVIFWQNIGISVKLSHLNEFEVCPPCYA